ncbi:hypothetical protein ACFL21_03530 [Patescibacteria group bacterium]
METDITSKKVPNEMFNGTPEVSTDTNRKALERDYERNQFEVSSQLSQLISQYQRLLRFVKREIEVEKKIQDVVQERILIQKGLVENIEPFNKQDGLAETRLELERKIEELQDEKFNVENGETVIHESQGNFISCFDLIVARMSEFSNLQIDEALMKDRLREKHEKVALLINDLRKFKDRLKSGEKIVGENQANPTQYKITFFEIPNDDHSDTNEQVYNDISKEKPYEAAQYTYWRNLLNSCLQAFEKSDHFQEKNGTYNITRLVFDLLKENQEFVKFFEIANNVETDSCYFLVRKEYWQGDGKMFKANIVTREEIQEIKTAEQYQTSEFEAPIGTGHIKFRTLLEQAQMNGEAPPNPRDSIAIPSARMSQIYEQVAQRTHDQLSNKAPAPEAESEFKLRETESPPNWVTKENREPRVSKADFKPIQRDFLIRKVHIDKLKQLCVALKYNSHTDCFTIPRKYASALVNLPGYRVTFQNNAAYLTVENPMTSNSKELEIETRPFIVNFSNEAPTLHYLPAVRRPLPRRVRWLNRIRTMWKGFKGLIFGNTKAPIKRKVRTYKTRTTDRIRN